MIDPELILVSGLPRSGTSLMMQMLYRAGLPVVRDNTRKADQSNPEGYFEYTKVKRIYEDNAWLYSCAGQAIKIVTPLLLYLPDDLRYKILYMHRNLEEIMASQRSMLQRHGQSAAPEEESDLFNAYTKLLKQVQRFMDAHENMQVMHVNFAALIHAPEKTAQEVQRFLQRPLDLDAMQDAVRPELYRERAAHES